MSHHLAGSPFSGPCKVGSPLGSPVIGPCMVVSPRMVVSPPVSPGIGPCMVVSPPVSHVRGSFTGLGVYPNGTHSIGGSPQGAGWGLSFPIASVVTHPSGGAPSKRAATHSSGGAPPGRPLTRSAMHKTGSAMHKTGFASKSKLTNTQKTGDIQDSQEIQSKIQELRNFHADLQTFFEKFRTKLKESHEESHDLNAVKEILSKIGNINKTWDTSFGNNREIVDIGEFQSQCDAYLNKTEEVVMYLKNFLPLFKS